VIRVAIALEDTPNKKWLTQEQRRSPAQIRMLNRKAVNLRKAFDDLSKYWDRIGGSWRHISEYAYENGNVPEPPGNPYLVESLEEHYEVSAALEAIEAAIKELRLPASMRVDVLHFSPDSISITNKLHQFFTGECGLTKNDASQRIAKIENAFWRGHLLDCDPHSHTPDRSDAIRKRLKRHPSSTTR
jgi:hypothetical protein